MVLFARQKILLDLIHRAGGSLEKLRLVKLAFLLRQECIADDNAFYGFVPYHRGPFSFALYHDLAKLEKQGLIASADHHVSACDPSTKKAPPPQYSQAVHATWQSYGHLKTSALVDNVYARYPWFTTRCKTPAKRAHTVPVAPLAIYTAGYEGLSLDDFLNRLLKAGIRQLIDVRKNPVARRFGFHRSTMERTCGHLDIAYRHVPDLGIPSDMRMDLSTQTARNRLFAQYRSAILPRNPAAFSEVEAWMRATPSVLVCMEAKPCECHRSHLGKALAVRTGLPQIDLGEAYAAA